jgi:hypothetical protein
MVERQRAAEIELSGLIEKAPIRGPFLGARPAEFMRVAKILPEKVALGRSLPIRRQSERSVSALPHRRVGSGSVNLR